MSEFRTALRNFGTIAETDSTEARERAAAEVIALARSLIPTQPMSERLINALETVPDNCDDETAAKYVLATIGAEAVDVLANVRPMPKVRTDWVGAPPDRRWIVEGWLPAGRAGLLTGPGGSGKSKLALMLAAAIAGTDRHWIPPNGPTVAAAESESVVLATWEDEPDEIFRRLLCCPSLDKRDSAHQASATLTANDLFGERLHVVDLAGCGALWEPVRAGSRHTSTLGELTGAGEYLRRHCEKAKARLLVIDPLAAAYACNENDRGLVRSFMSSWDRWARDHDCAVILIAHPSKSGPDYSGSTDWHGAPRFLWTLAPEEDSEEPPSPEAPSCLTCLKQSYGQKPQPLLLSDWRWWRVAVPTSEGDHRHGNASRRSRSGSKRRSHDDGSSGFV